VRSGAAGLNRYPDGAARALRREIAERHAMDVEQVVIGNGSCELLLLAGQAFLDPGTTVIYPDPSFGLYAHVAAAAGAEGLSVPLDGVGRNDLAAMAAAVDERTRLVIVCSPNNPTGGYVGASALEAFLDGLPEDLPVLVDEAYYDFVTEADRGRALSQARRRPNLMVLRTFSKAHGLCGLRIGYGMGSPAWIGALDRVRQPFNASSIAQAAALESLRHTAAIDRRVQETITERERVAAALGRMGVRFTPSQANFILVAPDAGDGIHERLLAGGVIVRDGAALGCPGELRVSLGTPTENDAFLAALVTVLGRSTPDAGTAVPELPTKDTAQP
jgi:histidinol-phosphate aminotransferase